MKFTLFFRKVVLLIMLFLAIDFVISKVLIEGLNRYFGLNEKADVLINGSSMVMNGFDRYELGKIIDLDVASYSHEGVSLVDRQAMLQHFYDNYKCDVKTIIFEIHPLIFSSYIRSKNVYTIFYPFMDVDNIDYYIKERASEKEYWVHKIIRTSRFDSNKLITVARGYLGVFGSFKTNVLDKERVDKNLHGVVNEIVIAPQKQELFEEIMQMIESNNSRALLVMMPMYDSKFKTFPKDDYKELCFYFEDFCSRKDGFEFLDLNIDSITTNAQLFFDDVHLNVKGQKVVTDIVAGHL